MKTGLLLETTHMVTSFRRQRRESLRTRLSTWSIKIMSFALNNFAPEEFFGWAKSVSMNGPKFLNTTGIMKAFSVERKYLARKSNSLCPEDKIFLSWRIKCKLPFEVTKQFIIIYCFKFLGVQSHDKSTCSKYLRRVLVCFLVVFDLLFVFVVLSCRILDSASLFILYVHEHDHLVC